LPIDEEERKRGTTWQTTEGQITGLLLVHDREALSLTEILSTFNINLLKMAWPPKTEKDFQDIFKFTGINRILERLVAKGKIEARIIKTEHSDETYYKIVR